MNWMNLLWLVFLQTAAPMPDLPAANGVYLRPGSGDWTRVEIASMSDMKSKGMSDFLDTAGLTNLDVIVAYQGAQSKLQLPSPRPIFYVRGTGSPNDAMIVSLTRKGDQRVVRTATSNATVGNRAGFKKDDIRNVTVTVFSDKSFSVTPESDLKAGEYALVFGFASAAYDFGITRVKK
jgi:hypothetical protein